MSKATPPERDSELETVTSADGTEIAFERTGSGPPLVLVHGAFLDHRFWNLFDVLPTLAEGATVYAIDRRGRGGSGDAEEYDLKREFEDIAAVIESIDEPVTLLGHSTGGFYSLEAALRTDNLSALVLYEPLIPFSDERGYKGPSEETLAELTSLLEAGEIEQAFIGNWEKNAGWTPKEVDALRSAPMWQEYVERFPALLPRVVQILDTTFDPERFADLTVPTLLLAGSESSEWAHETIEAIDDALSDTRVVTFDGHRHMAMFTAPDRFTDEVLAFMREGN